MFRKLIAASLSATLCSLSLVGLEAQEAQIQVLGVGGEQMTPEMRERMANGAASMSFQMAGPSSTISLGGFGGVDPNNRSQLFNLLTNESVKRELQLTDEQFTGAKKIMDESRKRLGRMVTEQLQNREPGSPIRLGGNAVRDLMEEGREQAEAAIEEILLPEQLDRVRQLAYQVEIAQEGLGVSLTEGRLGKEIGVHDGQKQNLLDRAKKIEAEAQQAIIAIRAKARAKLFQELTPDQRKDAEKLLGKYFLYEEPSLGQQLRRSFRSMNHPTTEDED